MEICPKLMTVLEKIQNKPTLDSSKKIHHEKTNIISYFL
jgi:hypothetical protein